MIHFVQDDLESLAALMLLRVTLLLLVAWVLHGILRGRNPWWQISLWRITIGAIVLIVFTAPCLPGWGPRLRLARVDAIPRRETTTPSAAGTEPVRAVVQDVRMFEPIMPVSTDIAESTDGVDRPQPVPVPAEEMPLDVPASTPSSWRVSSSSVKLIALGAYLIVVGFLLVRLLWQHAELRRILRTGIRADDRAQATAAAAANVLGMRTAPVVLISSDSSGPLAAGLRQQMIVVPSRFLQELSEEQLRFVMAHECGHFKGHDLFWSLAARLLRIVVWPHPLSWGIPEAHRFACDVRCDALATSGDGVGYTKMLAALAISLQPQRSPAGALAFFERSEVLRRIRLIDANVRANRPSRFRTIPAALGTAIAIGLIGSLGTNALRTGVAFDQGDHAEKIEQFQPGQIANLEVTVVGPDETPVEGADVTTHYFTYTYADAAKTTIATVEPKSTTKKTDSRGLAVVDYPASFKRDPVQAGGEGPLTITVVHPDFVRSTPKWNNGARLNVMLQRGRRVRLSAKDTQTGNRIADRLFMLDRQIYNNNEFQWKRLADGTYESPTLDTDLKQLLVVWLPEDQPPKYSDLIDLSARPVGECRLEDIPVSAGARLQGRLSDNVPRPVKGGMAKLTVDFATELNLNYVSWRDSVRINDDGTFEFASVPRHGWIQLVAECDGWDSSSRSVHPLSAERTKWMEEWGGENLAYDLVAQQFPSDAGQSLRIEMEATAECLLTLRDDKGLPLPKVQIGLQQGAFFYPSDSQFGALYPHTADMLIPRSLEPWEQDMLNDDRFSVVTDSNGQATLRNLPGRKFMVQVNHELFQPGTAPYEIELKPGEKTKLTLQPRGAHQPGQNDAGDSVPAWVKQLDSEKVERENRLPNSPVVGLDLSQIDLAELDLRTLKSLTHLKKLNFGFTRITDAKLAEISQLTQLEHLELRDARVSDAGLESLKGMKNLQIFDLSDNRLSITDSGLEHLQDLTNLRSIQLGNVRLSGSGLKHLQKLTKLVQLLFGQSTFSDEALEDLGRLTSLKRLSLSRSNITDDTLIYLQQLTNLETLFILHTQTTLELRKTNVDDSGMTSLSRLKNLEVLVLDRTGITDAGMMHLKSLAKLRRLSVQQTGVTAVGRGAIREALPKCQINEGR